MSGLTTLRQVGSLNPGHVNNRSDQTFASKRNACWKQGCKSKDQSVPFHCCPAPFGWWSGRGCVEEPPFGRFSSCCSSSFSSGAFGFNCSIFRSSPCVSEKMANGGNELPTRKIVIPRLSECAWQGLRVALPGRFTTPYRLNTWRSNGWTT